MAARESETAGDHHPLYRVSEIVDQEFPDNGGWVLLVRHPEGLVMDVLGGPTDEVAVDYVVARAAEDERVSYLLRQRLALSVLAGRA